MFMFFCKITSGDLSPCHPKLHACFICVLAAICFYLSDILVGNQALIDKSCATGIALSSHLSYSHTDILPLFPTLHYRVVQLDNPLEFALTIYFCLFLFSKTTTLHIFLRLNSVFRE